MDHDAFIHEILKGRCDYVVDYIRAHGDVRVVLPSGVSLIRWCSHCGDLTAVKLLLDHGVNIEALGDNYDLNGAVFHGHYHLAAFLIDHGADVNYPMPLTGETPLHSALCKSNRPVYEKMVKLLIGHGANVNTATISNVETDGFMRDVKTVGETPLHRAAAFSTQCIIDLLLAKGASREAKDCNGLSPLSWASWPLRPDSILRKLCYGKHRINSMRCGTYDHGSGWTYSEMI